MKLHSAPASPFARKCRVCIMETQQSNDVEVVAAMGTPLNAENMPTKLNPLGKIPALEREDGTAIYDSRVITRFLNDKVGGELYPTETLWDTLTLEATADGILDAAVLMVYEARCRPEDAQSEEWLDGQWAKISRALDALGGHWMSHLGGPVDMAHIAVGCALEYLDFRHDARDWRIGRTQLSLWQAAFSERESMLATQPKDA